MRLSDFDLRQMDDEWISRLPPDRLRNALQRALEDLKEARDRLNMNPGNSSRPSGSMAPWESTSPASTQQTDSDASEPDKADNAKTPNVEAPSGEDANPDATSLKQDGSKSVRRSRGKQPGAPGYGRTQILPVTGTDNHVPELCAACGAALSHDGQQQAWTAWDQIDVVPLSSGQTGLQLNCTRHTFFERRCHCDHLTRAMPYRAPPDCLWDNIDVAQWRLVGPYLAAMIVILSLRMRLSRARIQEFFGEFVGLSLSIGVIDQTIREAGRASVPLEDELVADLQQAPLLHVDETPWKESGCLLWLWTLVSATTVFFTIGGRDRDMLVNVLEGKFIGTLMSDGYAIYRVWQDRLRCWAHLVRKMRGLAESTDARVAGVGGELMAIFDVLMAAIYDARLDPSPRALPVEHAPSIDRLKQLCQQHHDDTHDKVRTLARELLLDWDVILRPVAQPQLPLTNNTAERALRHWVISRRISHGTRSAGGTRAFALLASVIETCRLRKASSWRYLATVVDAARNGFTPPSLPGILPIAGGV